MSSGLPIQLVPYAKEYESIQHSLLYIDVQLGRSSIFDREVEDLLAEADVVPKAYIEFTKGSGDERYHQYFTDLANDLVGLSENLNKRREDPVETPPLSRSFKFQDEMPVTGDAVGSALIHTMEFIYLRIKELEVEEFVATMAEKTELLARKKDALLKNFNALFDKAYASDTKNLEKLLNQAKSLVDEKRAASISVPLEPGLDMLDWHCHRVELILDDVDELMSRGASEKMEENWKPDTLERCQLASRYCRELEEMLAQYFSENPGTLLQPSALNLLPEIDPEGLMGRSYGTLSVKYRIALKDFSTFVSLAITAVETRKISAEADSIFASAQTLLALRERQLAATREQSRPPVAAAATKPSNLLEGITGYSFKDYAILVAAIRLQEIRRISVLSDTWNKRVNWKRGRDRSNPAARLDLDAFNPVIKARLQKLVSEGRDPTAAREPLGWWDSAE